MQGAGQQLVLISAEDDTNRRIIAFDVFLIREIAEIEIHLADVVVLHLTQLQVDEHEAAQDAVIKDQIHPVIRR